MAFSEIGAYQYYTSIGDTETASKYSSTDGYGTINIPVVIRNIYEFGNSTSSEIAYDHFYMIMVSDINMDDYPELDKLYSNPFQNAIILHIEASVHIDFNGYCIRNLIVRNFTFKTQSNYAFIKFYASYGRSTVYLDNVRIENFVISNFTTTTTTSMNYSLFWNYGGNTVINNMYVSIYHNRDKSLAIQDRYNMFSSCLPVDSYTTKIFNLYTKFSGNINKATRYDGNNNSLLYIHNKMKICDWTIDFRDFYWIDTYPSGDDNLLYNDSANIDTVHIVGKLNYTRSNSSGNGKQKRNVCVLGGSTVTNVLCDAEINHVNKESSDNISSYYLYDIVTAFNSSSSFINKDKVKFSESYSKIGHSIKCTTEQLKDPAFLTQNGLVFMQT